jgi:uncharacterized membrane protein
MIACSRPGSEPIARQLLGCVEQVASGVELLRCFAQPAFAEYNKLIMGRVLRKISAVWVRWGAYAMAVFFAVVFFALICLQYATFNARAPDLVRFLQGMWNTLHGRFMVSSLGKRSVLSAHFSPILILLAPLQLLWPDPRVYSLVQTIGFAVGGLLLYRIVQKKHAEIAPWFLLAFYATPVLHELALLELRRITLAVPFLALAFYGLATKNRRLTLIGLLLSLLCKEDVAIVVAMVGVYLLLFERDWRWGLFYLVLGIAWFGMVLYVVSPSLELRAEIAGSELGGYPGVRYFAEWGKSLPEIVVTMLKRPGAVLQHMFDEQGRVGLLRVLLPVGFVLPLLAPGWALLALPIFGYQLLSSDPRMHGLEEWYPTATLIILFAAIAVGLTRRSKRQARAITLVLLGFTLVGFLLYSPAPLGPKFRASDYRVLEHHRLAAEVVAAVPADAGVASTSAYLPHLAQREILYVYPWLPDDPSVLDYYLLDRNLKSYPMNEIERNDAINNLIADPNNVIQIEVDGIYLLRNGGPGLDAFAVGRTAEGAIRLDRVEAAPMDERGYYRTVAEEPIRVKAGQAIRATLYWEAVGQPEGECTVSVRIAQPDGRLVAQHDMKPSNGARPTSWWQTGWKIRDVYYLTIAPDAAPGAATLDLLLYDSYTGEHVPFDNGETILQLIEVVIAG